MNARVLGIGLELLLANGGRLPEINRLLFSDDTALVTDSEEKLIRLVSEFGRVGKIPRKLQVNAGKSKVMRCLRYVNVGLMDEGLCDKLLEEVDCF